METGISLPVTGTRKTPAMTEEFLRCPHCRKLARHHVTRERVPATKAWCLACFAIWTPDEVSQPHPAWHAA